MKGLLHKTSQEIYYLIVAYNFLARSTHAWTIHLPGKPGEYDIVMNG